MIFSTWSLSNQLRMASTSDWRTLYSRIVLADLYSGWRGIASKETMRRLMSWWCIVMLENASRLVSGWLLGTVAITPSQSVKNLDVILDSQLTMNDQIMSVYRKSYFNISRIARIWKYLSRTSAAQLVHVFVTSTLDYRNSILVELPAKRLLKLWRVQNSAARLVYGVVSLPDLQPCFRMVRCAPGGSQQMVYKSLQAISLSNRCQLQLTKIWVHYIWRPV